MKNLASRRVNSSCRVYSEIHTADIPVDYRKHIGKKFEDYRGEVFGASELGTYVNATPSIARGNTKRLICRSFYYSLGLTFTRGSHQPDYRWSLNIAYGPLFLLSSLSLFLFLLFSFRLSIFPTVFSYLIHPLSAPFPSQARLSQMQKIERRETFDPGQSQRELDGSKYFHTRCGLCYSWQTSVTPFARRCRIVLLPVDAAIKQDMQGRILFCKKYEHCLRRNHFPFFSNIERKNFLSGSVHFEIYHLKFTRTMYFSIGCAIFII